MIRERGRAVQPGRAAPAASQYLRGDSDIDSSDVPEIVDWSGAEVSKFYRPAKKSVTMRLDGDVIDRLKSYGRGYQTRVKALLRHARENSQKTQKTV